MQSWSLTIHSPAMRALVRRNRFGRRRTTAAAVTATLATLTLGSLGGPALPRPESLLATGLIAIAGTGLLAWLCAKLTVLPRARPLDAALAASLIAALVLPAMGIAALALPLALSLAAAHRRDDQRSVALMVQCGALAVPVLGAINPFAAFAGFAILLGTVCFRILRGLSGAANDNPSMERAGIDNGLPGHAGYDSKRTDSIPGKWGVSNVQ